MALKWDQSERSQNFRYKVTAVFVRGLFSEGVAKGSRRQQMRCRLILLITEHPIQQGIRKGGVRHFCDEDGRTDGRTEWRILGSWMFQPRDLQLFTIRITTASSPREQFSKLFESQYLQQTSHLTITILCVSACSITTLLCLIILVMIIIIMIIHLMIYMITIIINITTSLICSVLALIIIHWTPLSITTLPTSRWAQTQIPNPIFINLNLIFINLHIIALIVIFMFLIIRRFYSEVWLGFTKYLWGWFRLSFYEKSQIVKLVFYSVFVSSETSLVPCRWRWRW